MALDPLANINQSISEVEAAQDPLSAFNRMFSEVNEGIPTNPYPVISAPIPRTTPTAVDVNQNLVGNEVTGPAPGVNNATPQGNKSFTDAALDYLDDAENWAKDEYKYGRTYSYGAGWKNMQFEKYYTHPNYKKLGFSPYRDNEELYNENSTWADDWRRSTSQYWKLLSNAFGSSVFGSDDFKAAETMQEGLALGSSSKEGIGSSITNFGLSSMYTLGIGAEILAENAVLFAVEAGALALAPETLGATLPTVAAAATRQAANIGRFTKAIQGTYDFLKALKQARNVKEFYDASKIGKAGVAAAKFLNPLENTYQFTSFLAKGEKVWTSTEKLALAAHGFGHFFKDIRMISLGVEEAGLEGAMARSEYHQKLVDEYYAKNGRMPDPGSQDAQDIYQKAASVDFTVSMANLPAIFLTNKIFFGKYLRGFPTLSSIAKTVEKGSTRYLVGVGAGKVLEKGAYEYAEKGAGRKAAEFFMSSPYLPWSREYFVTNLPEALQENLQDAISSSVIAYHEKIDKDPSVAGFWEGMSQFGTSVKGQLTGQGLETFLSGYFTGTLMGGISGPTIGIFETIASRTKSGKAKVEAAKERRRVREEAIKDAVNGMAMDAVNVGERNATTASKVKNYMDEADKAADEGNEYKYKSAVDAAFASKAYTLAATDKTKLFTDHIDDMLTLEDEDLAKAYNMPVAEAQDVRRRLNNARQRALDVKDTYEIVKKEYPNPVDLSLIDPKKNEDLYKKMLAKYQAHEFAIETITTSTEALRRTNGRLIGIVNEFSQASPWLSLRRGAQEIKDAGASDITALLDNYQRQRLIETLELEVDTLKEGTPEQKKKAKLKQTKIDELKKWNDIAFKFTLIAKAREEAFRNKDLDLTGVNKLINDLTSEMYPIFDKYTKLIAEEQGGTLMSKELGKAFTKVRDYHLLDSDSNAYTKALNILNDPLYFDRYISAIETAQEQLQATKTERIIEGYKKFLDLKDSNDLLNAIYDQGLFVIPENVEEFLKNPRTAKFELYDIASKEPIAPDNPKYEAFQNILNDRYPVEEVVTEEVETEVVEEEAPAQKAISVVDDINTMPKELQEELIKKYESLKTYFAEERPDVKFPYPSFDQFLKRSPEAKQIIEAYNKKNNLKPAPAETKAGVFTPTTPYKTPKGPELTTATKPKAPVSDKKADVEKYRGKSKFSSKKEKTTLYLSSSLSVENSKEELKNTIFDLLDVLSKNKDVIFLEGGIRRIIESSQTWYPFSVLGDYLAGRYKTSIDKVISEFKKSGFTESELDIIKESLENKVSPYAELDALKSKPTPVSDIKGTLSQQGTTVELEIKGDTGKEFLLTVNRKGNISLFSEKQSDGSYKAGEFAPKEAVDKLYNKYVSEKTRTAITNWLNAFTGSWAAPETQDGKNYTKAEKELNTELAALERAKPAESKVEVISENYTPELLRANPNKLFLFGDNNQRTGKGGQAIIRDEPNAAGISTKLLPKNTPEAFMSDDQLADNKAVIDSDIKKAKDRAAKEGKTIVLPKGGFGTGLAALATKAPQTFAYLNQRLQKEFGFNNTTGELVKPEAKPVEEVTTASVQEVKERLKALNEKTLIVSPSNKKVYIDSQNPEDEYKRVTNLTGDKTFNSETAATRGTIIDALLRRFIIKPFKKEEIKSIYNAEIERLEKKHEQEQEALGEEKPFVYKEFSDNMLENLFNIFEEVSKVVDEKDLTLISDIPTLWGILNGEKYAGTIDLLGISKTGEVYIIDLKTSGPDRRVHYAMDEFLKKEGGDLYDSIISKIKAVEELNFKGNPIKTNNILAVKNFTKEEKIVADKFIKKFDDQINEYNSLPVYDYKQSDAVQQSAYAELLRQRTGITVKNIVVFPITVKETKQSYISAIANKDAKGNMTMQVTVDRNLFPEQALSPEASEIVEKLEEPVEEAPDYYISPKDAVRNKILVKLGQLRDQMKIERNPDNIKKALDKIENEVADAGLPYTENYALAIDKIIQAIRKELKSINRIEIGDYIIFEGNPSSKFVVVNKNDKEITLYNDALPAEERVNTEPEILTNKDMYKISKIISAETPETEELTSEEKEINVENVKAMDEFLKDDEAVKAALNNTKSKEEIEKGFLEDLDSCVP